MQFMVSYLSKRLLIVGDCRQIIFFKEANADVLTNRHLFKQTVASYKQIIFFEAANTDVLINGY